MIFANYGKENKNKNMSSKIKSKFASESEANNAAAATVAENPNAMQIFAPAGAVDLTQFKRRNLPAMIKPGDVAVGGIIQAEILGVVDSPVSTVKGKLLHLQTAEGTEFTFPATGVIRNALVPGTDDDELQTALEKYIGKIIILVRTPDKMSAKYKKSMFMFDVYTQ